MKQDQDKAVEFNSKILKAKDLLKKIKQIDLDIKPIEKEIKKIEKETAKEVDDNYQKFEVIGTAELLNTTLINTYDQAIQRISKIIDFLIEEYDAYYSIYSGCQELELNLKNFKSQNISSCVKQAQQLVIDMNTTSTRDYNFEGKLVEKVYSLAYQVIKIEIVCTQKATLLNNIKQNEINIQYIENLIEQDISFLDLTADQNLDINSKIASLNKKGLKENNLLDKELIYLLALSTNESLIQEGQIAFLEECKKLQTHQTEMLALKEEQQKVSATIETLIQKKKNNLKKAIRKKIFLIGNIASATAISVGGYNITRNICSTNTYETRIENYDSSTNKTTSPKPTYQEKTSEYVKITEYTPWIEPGYFREQYTRDIYTYELSDFNLKPDHLQDYLTQSQNYNFTLIEHTPEIQTELPAEKLYKDNIYKITRLTQNLDQCNIIIDYSKLNTAFILETTILALLESIIIVSHKRKKYFNLKTEKRTTKEELKQAQQELLELNQEINTQLNNCEILQKHILEDYKRLPSPIQTAPEIKKRVREVKHLSLKEDDPQ